jgi:uncharacterized protein YdaU (DUF1376 family)
MAKVDIWMPVYIGDYLGDTTELSAEEHGAYMLLLMHYWLKKGEIGDDITRLARVCKVDEKTCSFILGYYFTLENGNYKNKRADEEMKNAEARRQSASENGRKGGRPPKNNPEITHSFSLGKANHNPEESSSPSPSPLQKEREEEEGESPPSSTFQNRTIPTEASKDATARIDRLRTAWNYMGLPECRYTIANFRDYERADCIRAVTFYTDDEIEAAIKNYAGILKSVDHEVFPYKGFTTFMAKGVEQYIDKADPWTIKKRRATEQEQKKAAEYKDRGGFEVPEATCKCCGHTWRTTQSICPKCHYEGGDIEDHKEWYRDRFGHDLE